MPLIVETGTGVAGANSFVPLADAEAFFVDRPSPAWSAMADDAAKEQALVSASEWLSARYEWRYSRATDAQGLEFPRTTVGLPAAILKATCRLAGLGLDLYALESRTAGIESVKAGSVEVSFGAIDRTTIPGADLGWLPDLLRPLIRGKYDGPMAIAVPLPRY